jgi:drug/metabolite transporter (DMT)-like permease
MLFLGEIPTVVKVLACAIIVSGVLLINRDFKKAT